jgi:hypothetical protein
MVWFYPDIVYSGVYIRTGWSTKGEREMSYTREELRDRQATGSSSPRATRSVIKKPIRWIFILSCNCGENTIHSKPIWTAPLPRRTD